MNEPCKLVSTPDAERWQHRYALCKLSARNQQATIPCAQVEVALQPPSLPRRLANFAQAATKHLVAGLPQASQIEIDRRFAICQTCPFYNGHHCTHSSCGCNVNSERKFLNKLAWAEQKCPVEKW